MSRSRDIAEFLGKTESANTTNVALLNTTSNVGLDSAQVSSIANAAGLTVYATKENLPASGLTSGDQAYVTDTSRLYISNGSGWYNVALINATPSLTIDPTGVIELSKVGATTTITLTGTDSDNAVDGLTFSVDSDGNFGGMGTISQDSSVFTVTPLSEDSATTSSSTLTFKASDGISFGSGTSILTLTFKVDNSKHTSLLLKADTAATDQQVDASSNAHTITQSGVRSTALTPYHPGGYSWGWAGDGTDYFTIESPTSALSFGTGDFCLEMWIYPFDVSSSILADMRPTSTNGAYIGAFGLSSGNVSVGFNGQSGASLGFITSGAPVNVRQWNHIVLNRESGTSNIFVNGVREYTTATEYNFLVGKFRLFKNAYSAGGISDGTGGWIRDYRVVKGSSVYGTGTTLSVPVEPLTAITGTSLLLFGKARRHDAVGTETVSYQSGHFDRIGPYNYQEYTSSEYGGSVYFDGNDNLDLDFNAIGTSDFTIECWVYIDDSVANQVICDTRPTSVDNTTGINIQFRSNNVAYVGTSGTGLITGTTVMADYSWNHIAVTRSGSTMTLWVNGVSQGTTTHTTNLTSSDLKIGTNRSGASVFNGNISDFRLVKSAVYTSNFDPPTAPLTAIPNTEVLTCTNKNNIWDTASSTSITKTGNVTASNTERKFTTSSAVYFDGNSDHLDFNAAHPSVFALGSNDFTIETWVNFSIASSDTLYRRIFMADDSGHVANNFQILVDVGDGGYGPAGAILIWAQDGSNNNSGISSQTSINDNNWHHIAISRTSGTVRFFIDGVRQGTNLTNWTHGFTGTTVRPRIGSSDTTTGGNYAGYIQDFRFTNGFSRYTSDNSFTPPTAESKG